MGLFEKKKKDAERCPICGKEISFFSGLVIADGTICDDCEKMVRGQFNIEEYYGRENWKISTSDPLKAMTVEELKDMINEKKAEQTQVVEEIGGDYAAIAKVEKTFGIAPKATDVGLKRAKALKNRIVATSYIMSGEFSRGDKEKEIETSFGETLSWEYLCYVREHPVVWNIPTKILYGDKDNLTSYETMSDFASKMGISLTVMNNGEHWFHTDEQMNFLDDWICESNR